MFSERLHQLGGKGSTQPRPRVLSPERSGHSDRVLHDRRHLQCPLPVAWAPLPPRGSGKPQVGSLGLRTPQGDETATAGGPALAAPPPPLWEGTAAVSSHRRGQRSARRPRPRRRGARLSQPGVVQLPSHHQGQAQGAQAGGHSGRPAQTSRPSAPAGGPGPLPRDTRTTPAPHAESQEPPLLPPPAPGCCREHPECERRRTPPSASTRRTPCCSLLMALAAFGDIKLASQEV